MENLKHDFRIEPAGESADRFRAWLESETVSTLQRCLNDPEGLKSMIFLYANRAYEAHLDESEIWNIFGKCFGRAGFPVEAESFAFDCLEFSANVAKQVHK